MSRQLSFSYYARGPETHIYDSPKTRASNYEGLWYAQMRVRVNGQQEWVW